MSFVFFAFISFQSLKGCSCVGISFCQALESLTDEEIDLVFMGSFIKSEPLESIFTAIQFKVIKIYHGEVITPSSVYFTGEDYINTDSTVWIISGNSSICMPDIDDETAIFALSYNKHNAFGGPPNEYGYAPHSCTPNYFPIAADNTVEGRIFNFNGTGINDTITVEEFEEAINDKCGLSSNTSIDYFSDNTVVYPQPTSGILRINNLENYAEWKLKLTDLSGRVIKELNSIEIDLSDCEAGIYFLQFVKDRQRFTKKIIKI